MGMNPTPPGQVPEALHLADQYAAAHAKWELEDLYGSSKSYTAEKLAERHAARANLERALHAAHVQNPAEIEHVAGDVSKNGAEVNTTTAQPAPAGATDTKTLELLSTTVGLLMGYREGGARQPYKPGSVVAKVVDEVVDHLKDWPTPQPSPTAQAASSTVLKAIREANMQLVRTGDNAFMLVTLKQATPQADSQPAQVEVADAMADSQYLAGVSAGWNAANADDPNAALQKLQESRAGYLKPLRAARAPADSVGRDAAQKGGA